MDGYLSVFDEECEELINAVKNIYEEVVPPPQDDNGSLFGGIYDNVGLLVGAVLVITLINAMKK